MTAEQQIKSDLAKYFSENNITDVKQGLETLKSLLTLNILTSCGLTEDSPEGVQAWTALQIKEESPFRYHSSEYLGTFIYNSKMYDLKYEDVMDTRVYYLHYNMNSCLQPELPDGVISCNHMFEGCALSIFTKLNNFNTSSIERMYKMFAYAILPPKFIINFNMQSCFDTRLMFFHCEFGTLFKFGNNFNISHVKRRTGMFEGSTINTPSANGIINEPVLKPEHFFSDFNDQLNTHYELLTSNDTQSLLQDDIKADNRIHITPEEIELGKQVANSIQNAKSDTCKLHVIVDDVDGLLSDSDFMFSLGCYFNNDYVTLSEEDKNRWDGLTYLHALCKHSNKSDEEFEVPIGSEISIGDTSMSFTIFKYQGKEIETDCLLFEINGDATLHCVILPQYSDQLEVSIKQLSGDIKPKRKY